MVKIDPLHPSDARNLVLSHAHSVGPFRPDADTAGIDALCEALDHLPLALILAASWLIMLTPEQLLRRPHVLVDLAKLDGTGGRHASLRACISTSWDQLAPEDSRALAILSLLDTPFPADLAQQLLADDPGHGLERLHRLHMVSLVIAVTHTQTSATGIPHYRLFASVRDFARKYLDDSARRAAGNRLFQWATQRAQSDVPTMSGPDPISATNRMIEALPLSLQAYTHTSTPEDKSTLIRLLFPVFQCVGFSDSILVLLREAATLGTGEAQLWSQLHSMDSRLRAGEQPVDEIMQLQAAAAQQGMTPLEAEIGIVLGIAHRDRGEIALSMTCLASAHMLAETTGQHTLIGRALIERAATLRGSGKHEIALRVLQTAHGHARRAKNIRLELIIAGSIGANERQLGHQLEAEASLRCALGIAQQLQSQENVAHISCNLANILVMDGRYAEAERLLTRSLTWYRTHGVLRSEGYVLQSIALAHMGRKQFRVAGCRTVEAMAAFRDAGNDMGTAYSTGMLGRILHATGDAPGALLRYHTAADGLARCNMPWLSGQFQALGAVAAADAGDWNTATELQQSAQTQLGDTSKAKALMAFVLSSFDAVKSGEAESVRQRIGSPRLDGDVLW